MRVALTCFSGDIKKIFFFLITVFFFVTTFQSVAQQTAQRDADGRGYLEYLPSGYHDNSDLYPVIIFLHGHGERGDGSPGSLEQLKKNGPPKYIENGESMCFEYNGVEECFIVLSPQQTNNRHGWLGYEVMPFVNNVMKEYRIDPARVYLTGLSMGGQGTWQTAYSEENSPNVFAAISPIAGRGDYDDACIVAQNNIPVWAFHGSNDNAIGLNSGERPINGMLACDSDPVPIFTIYDGVGHSGTWERAYKLDNSLHTPNLYQWFLAQRLGETPDQPPTVNAGDDLEITLPDNTATLQATANDVDGDISKIRWSRVSGPNTPSTNAADQLEMELSGMIEGSYNYRITVSDNDGLTASDQVIITVKPEPANTAPDVDAGNNQSITLPENSLNLNGSASDADGNIVSILWEQLSGPNAANIGSPSNLNTSISFLVEGSYTFSLTVIDDGGEEVTDNVSITVVPELANDPPVADAGNDLEVTLPENSITIQGNATDSDGTVESILWEQTSGPNTASSTDLSLAEITISNLIQGAYVFRLTVVDDDGDTNSDQLAINVLPPPPNDPPVADAGNDSTVTFPVQHFVIHGEGMDNDGVIESVEWSQISGPTEAFMKSPDQNNTLIDSLVIGNYKFQFKVRDDKGGESSDILNVEVVTYAGNQQPIADAGEDLVVKLPKNSVVLSAEGEDPDGEIISFQWVLLEGKNVLLTQENSKDVLVKGLDFGEYVFQLSVTDNGGLRSQDSMTVSVKVADEVLPMSAGLTKLFTPNGDGFNDLWQSSILEEQENCSVQIFTKQGTKVYENTDYNNDWEGTDTNGNALDEGAYYYILSCGEGFSKKGGVRIKK